MEIPEIARLKTALEMRKEILKLAIQKNMPEDKLWHELEIYEKQQKIISQGPVTLVGDVLKNIKLQRRKPGEYKILAEYLIGEELRKASVPHKLHGKVGKHAVNFLVEDHKLVILIRRIEVDNLKQEEEDAKRLKILMSRGYIVIKFDEVTVYRSLDECMRKIMSFCGTASMKGGASENS